MATDVPFATVVPGEYAQRVKATTKTARQFILTLEDDSEAPLRSHTSTCGVQEVLPVQHTSPIFLPTLNAWLATNVGAPLDTLPCVEEDAIT